MKSSAVVPEQPCNGFVLGLASGFEALPMQSLDLQRPEQRLAAGVSFALVSPQRRIFFSGDSGYAPHFAELGERYSPFDWVVLDAGQYDPRWANVHMNPE